MFGWVKRSRFAVLRRSSELIAQARFEAAARGSDFIDTNDLLLAILSMPERPAWRAVASLGVSPELLRATAAATSRRGDESDPSIYPLTRMSLCIVELASSYARMLGDYELGPEHVFLAFLGESRCAAYEVLLGLGLKPQELGLAVIRIAGWPVPVET